MVKTLLTNLLDDETQNKKYRTVKKKNVKLEAALNLGDNLGWNILKTAGFQEQVLHTGEAALVLLPEHESVLQINHVLLELKCATLTVNMYNHQSLASETVSAIRNEFKTSSANSQQYIHSIMPLPDDTSITSNILNTSSAGDPGLLSTFTSTVKQFWFGESILPLPDDNGRTNSKKRSATCDLTQLDSDGGVGAPSLKRARVDRHGIAINLSYSTESRQCSSEQRPLEPNHNSTTVLQVASSGLFNIANTCYLNSLLQTYYSFGLQE